MKSSVREFLAQIIDYAGLFPPAKLPMADALSIYLRERAASPHRWMLGRFVCPAARLRELLPLAQAHADRSFLSLTVLGQQATEPSALRAGVQAEIRAMEEFRQAWGNQESADVFEVALPRDFDHEQLPGVADDLHAAGLRGFFEVPAGPAWRGNIDRVIHALQLHAQAHVGMKLRCGGVAADAFPKHADIAFFIDRCRQALLPWKATAGLHHPLPHWDETLQLWHHGFLNVFGAGVLACVHSLTEEQINAIVSAGTPSLFRFDEDSFAWKDLTCTAAEVADARACFATSFGSCSFAEPCADLVAMGLLGDSA